MLPMTAEELARFNERRRVAREESERQYLVELARIEALERMEGRLNVSVLCRVTKRLIHRQNDAYSLQTRSICRS